MLPPYRILPSSAGRGACCPAPSQYISITVYVMYNQNEIFRFTHMKPNVAPAYRSFCSRLLAEASGRWTFFCRRLPAIFSHDCPHTAYESPLQARSGDIPAAACRTYRRVYRQRAVFRGVLSAADCVVRASHRTGSAYSRRRGCSGRRWHHRSLRASHTLVAAYIFASPSICVRAEQAPRRQHALTFIDSAAASMIFTRNVIGRRSS